MSTKQGQFTKATFVGLCIVGLVGCAIHLWGGLFYLNPFWYYVPPMAALSLLAVVSLRKTKITVLLAYLLATLFVFSYVVANGRWVAERLSDEGWFLFPDFAEAILVVILLAALHMRRAD